MKTKGSMKTKKGIIGRDWFAIIFSIVVGISSFAWFVPLSYGGQKTIDHKIEDQRLQLEADQELRILLQSTLLPGIGRSESDETMDALLRDHATFADLIDLIGYDAGHRAAYLNILHEQAYQYVSMIGSPSHFRLKISYTETPPGDFGLPASYASCDDATFCVLPNEPHGETVVGEVTYPSIKRGQAITVRLIQSKDAGGIALPPVQTQTARPVAGREVAAGIGETI